MNTKYQTLISVLDQLRKEAPKSYKSYHPSSSETEKINQARAKAHIHLFLKVKFGLLNFQDREKVITDGENDGGIDAFHFDHRNKILYFLQSKFRTSSDGFDNTQISLDELIRMDLDRITSGETSYEHGVPYNQKIKNLMSKMAGIGDISAWKYKVVLLANVSTRYSRSRISKLLAGFDYEVFDGAKCYSDLVFPLVSGTYYNDPDLRIDLVVNGSSANARIEYPVTAQGVDCLITILFVPTMEIGRVMSEYKNSVLKFNPRSYLSLSRNKVNAEIASSMHSIDGNAFSLFNNGITIVADSLSVNLNTGVKNKGQLYLQNPQIINGGQTSYTLSQIYERARERNEVSIFDQKEVLLKIITFVSNTLTENERLWLIEAVSRATNLQTPVSESDRRSNSTIQIRLQKLIFQDFGLFYERKEGEFFDGLSKKYLPKEVVVKRDIFLRSCYAVSGRPDSARSKGSNLLFEETSHDNLFKELHKRKINHGKLVLAYKTYLALSDKEKSDRKANANPPYGNALRYGKYAVVYVLNSSIKAQITSTNIDQEISKNLDKVLERWGQFEAFASRRRANKAYFGKIKGGPEIQQDFDNYYKVDNLVTDLQAFFRI